MDKFINIYHKDWEGKCIIHENNIYRDNYENENEIISNINNEICIKWLNWDNEYFHNLLDNIYIEKEFLKNVNIYLLLEKEYKDIIIYDKIKKQIRNDQIKFEVDNNKIINLNYENKIYKKIFENVYVLEDDIELFFNIETINFNLKKNYILNKFNNTFFEINNVQNEGKYISENNILYLKWDNGIEKKFLSNIYYESNELNYENIKVIKPNNFLIKDRVLFSNITLIKNKIYLTSIYYHQEPWKLNNIIFTLQNNNIIKKNTIEYKNYESCILITLELEKERSNIELQIEYDNYTKTIHLKQLKLPKKNIYAMTLFKNDYPLLKKYLEYYNQLGIDCFFLYYNNSIDDNFINEINIINQSKYEIILVEWNYDYWYKYNNNEKHHHAQVMAINDSLNILKNFCRYILYNDLDEYIKIENNFSTMINNNPSVDIFQFKCMFCKMGNHLIKYRNFYFEYDENKITKGNFWDKFREKNLIKVDKIHLMGVHEVVYEYSVDKLNKLYISYFYHFINYYEKNRIELMTQYIS